MNEIPGLILGLVLFLCTLFAYITGLKHGKELSKGNVPSIGIKTIIEAVKPKEEDKLTDELSEIMSASKESMLNSIKTR